MNLRSSADKNSSKISVIEKNTGANHTFHVINLKGIFEGNWAEVEVKFWNNNQAFCNSDKPTKNLRGWIKYLDDKGYPNIIDNAACLPL